MNTYVFPKVGLILGTHEAKQKKAPTIKLIKSEWLQKLIKKIVNKI